MSRNATKSIENGTILSREGAADIIYERYLLWTCFFVVNKLLPIIHTLLLQLCSQIKSL